MKHTAASLILVLASICFAHGGTFQVLECQVNTTYSYNDLAAPPQVSTASIDAFTGQFFASAHAMITYGQITASLQAPTEYKWKIKYIPDGPADTPGSEPYYCMVESRNKSKAKAELFADGETATYSKAQVWRGNVQPLTRFAEIYDDFKDPRNNPIDGAIEEDGDSNVPWDYEGGYYWPGVVFESTSEGWIGWATVIDLTPAMQMNLNVDELGGYMSRGIGFLKKQMHMIAVNSLQVDNPWNRN